MKLFQQIGISLIVMFSPVAAMAVTDKEMEEAQTIATKNYLRYANNGSGYLDEVSVKTMDELEKVLKPKEKENIKAFKTIAKPSDYKSWDKDKLVEFWSVTAFATPGLLEEGKAARTRTKNQIKAMTVAELAKEEEPTPSPTPEPASVEEPKVVQNDKPVVEEQPTDTAALFNDENEIAAMMEENAEEVEVKKESSNTWVYILALAILVAAVIGLVVFATKVMKGKNDNNRPNEGGNNQDDEVDFLRDRIRDYESDLDHKDNEITRLSKKLESANRQIGDLEQKVKSLMAEIALLRERLDRTPANTEPEDVRNDRYAEERMVADTRKPVESRSSKRVIFLGRVNSKGIFVRADRNLNIGHSLYQLETADGFTGTFTVIDNPEVWDMAMRLPREYLAFGCLCPDIEDTEGMSMIVNDTPGSAVFEGGCWHVTRKARIHYD